MVLMHMEKIKKINRMKTVYALIAFICCSFLFGTAFAVSGPTEQLKPTLQILVEILKDPALKGDEHKVERRAKIMAQIKQGFDFREMSQRVVGKEWKGLTVEKQDHFQELFTKLLENAYIGKIEGFSGKEIQYVEERLQGNRAIVSTRIENNSQLIPLDYIMIQKEARWMVYDINIEGVSLVRNYMEQFKSILRRDNFDGLVKLLEEKNSTFN
jgi:phospholipid transport system substrate-binding protein